MNDQAEKETPPEPTNCFVFFIPADRERPLSDAEVEASGLSKLYTASELTSVFDRARGGFVAAPKALIESKPLMGYYRHSSMKWTPSGTGYFVRRYFPDRPIDPTTLLRPTAIKGAPWRMDDGYFWQVPIARMFDSSPEPITLLPAKLEWDGEQFVAGEVKKAYRHLLDLVTEFWDQWYPAALENVLNHDIEKDPQRLDGGRGMVTADHLTKSELAKLAVDILAVNYRIGPAEAGELGILTNEKLKHSYLTVLVCCDAGGALALAIQQADAKKKSTPTQPSKDSTTSVGAVA